MRIDRSIQGSAHQQRLHSLVCLEEQGVGLASRLPTRSAQADSSAPSLLRPLDHSSARYQPLPSWEDCLAPSLPRSSPVFSAVSVTRSAAACRPHRSSSSPLASSCTPRSTRTPTVRTLYSRAWARRHQWSICSTTRRSRRCRARSAPRRAPLPRLLGCAGSARRPLVQD